MKAVVLVSGGLDSATLLAIARRDGFECYALSFRYGQRHAVELEAAGRVVRDLGAAQHQIMPIDLSSLGGSALTDLNVDVPEEPTEGIPITYVPARNTVFLSLALAWAEVLGAQDIFIGVNAVDYSGYPDCRPEFLTAFERLAALATAAGSEGGTRYRVHAPLMDLGKREIVLRAAELGVDLGLTHTCYDPLPAAGVGPDDAGAWLACGRCDACELRLRGFEQAGLCDPIAYAGRPVG